MATRYELVDPHILGNRLRVAREALGLTQQLAADAIGVARTTIVAMEKGERKPRPAELTQLAELYQQDPHNLLRQIDPVDPNQTLLGHFRRTARADVSLEEELRRQVEYVQHLMREYRELEAIYGAAKPQIHAPDIRVPDTQSTQGIASPISIVRFAEDVANTERSRLDLGDAPIGDLFDVLAEEEEGLCLFQCKLPASVSGFFGYDEALGACIVINQLHDPGRRHWSLAHEYAHLVTRSQFPGFKILYTMGGKRLPQSERFANAFATALLMPASSVRRRFLRIKESQGEFQSGDIMRMAHAFRVSFEAMALRLEELELIPPGTEERLKMRGYKPHEALKTRQLEPFQINNRTLPLRYEYLVCMAAQKNLITMDQVMRYLGTDRISAKQRIRDLSLQPFVTESGTQIDIEVPLIEPQGA